MAKTFADPDLPVSRFSDITITGHNAQTIARRIAGVLASSPDRVGLGEHSMAMTANVVVALVAALHLYFLVLEMFLWTKPLGLKTFRNSPEKAADSAVLAANQGLYNGFLAAGLIWGLFHPNAAFAFEIKIFFLLCVIAAGLYGAATVSRRILLVQAAPAAIGLILLVLA
jgi:putative membrane protein